MNNSISQLVTSKQAISTKPSPKKTSTNTLELEYNSSSSFFSTFPPNLNATAEASATLAPIADIELFVEEIRKMGSPTHFVYFDSEDSRQYAKRLIEICGNSQNSYEKLSKVIEQEKNSDDGNTLFLMRLESVLKKINKIISTEFSITVSHSSLSSSPKSKGSTLEKDNINRIENTEKKEFIKIQTILNDNIEEKDKQFFAGLTLAVSDYLIDRITFEKFNDQFEIYEYKIKESKIEEKYSDVFKKIAYILKDLESKIEPANLLEKEIDSDNSHSDRPQTSTSISYPETPPTNNQKSYSESDDELPHEIEDFERIEKQNNKLEKNMVVFTLSPEKSRDQILKSLSYCHTLILGEASHDDNTVWDVLSEEYVFKLKINNVRTIFVEHLYKEHIIELQQGRTEMIFNHLNKNTFLRFKNEAVPTEKMINFLLECHKQNIELVALDEKRIYEHNKRHRIPLLNSRVISIIEKSKINAQNKALIYIGAAHTNHHNHKKLEHRFDQEFNRIGISEIIANSCEVILQNAESELDVSSVLNGCVIKVEK